MEPNFNPGVTFPLVACCRWCGSSDTNIGWVVTLFLSLSLSFCPRIGPVLTAKHLTRNLLRMLNLCYLVSCKKKKKKTTNVNIGHQNLDQLVPQGPEGVAPLPPPDSAARFPDRKIRVSTRRVRGDLLASRVLECLAEIACLYGDQVRVVNTVQDELPQVQPGDFRFVFFFGLDDPAAVPSLRLGPAHSSQGRRRTAAAAAAAAATPPPPAAASAAPGPHPSGGGRSAWSGRAGARRGGAAALGLRPHGRAPGRAAGKPALPGRPARRLQDGMLPRRMESQADIGIQVRAGGGGKQQLLGLFFF